MERKTPTTETELRRAVATGALARRDVVRRGLRAGLGLAAVAALALTPRSDAEARGTSIPPNCIFVCCDGTCDSWKMCMKCVTWPKDKTPVAAQASSSAEAARASAEDGRRGKAGSRRASRRRRGAHPGR